MHAGVKKENCQQSWQASGARAGEKFPYSAAGVFALSSASFIDSSST